MATRASDVGSNDSGRTPAQLGALAFGVIYLVVGIWGFILTGFDNFAGDTNIAILGLFEVNPLHNIVHLAIGIGGIAMASKDATARQYGWLLAVVYGLTFLYGLFEAGSDAVNLLSINGADNVLHLLSAIGGVAIAKAPGRERAATRH